MLQAAAWRARQTCEADSEHARLLNAEDRTRLARQMQDRRLAQSIHDVRKHVGRRRTTSSNYPRTATLHLLIWQLWQWTCWWQCVYAKTQLASQSSLPSMLVNPLAPAVILPTKLPYTFGSRPYIAEHMFMQLVKGCCAQPILKDLAMMWLLSLRAIHYSPS